MSDLKVLTLKEFKSKGIDVDVLFWVGCSGSFDERSKKRDNGYDRNNRTRSLVEKELKKYDEVISKYKSNVEIRSSQTWEDCENIATEIFESLNLMDLPK